MTDDRTKDGPERAVERDGGRGDVADGGRRRFLTAAGIAGAGAVAAGAATVVRAEVAESPEEQIQGRYERTPHVERFYFLNRL